MEAHFAAAQKIAARGAFWTQGGGGNVSLKSTDAAGRKRIEIKASGHRLDAMGTPSGAVAVDAETLTAALRALMRSGADSVSAEQQYARLLQESAEKRPDAARPSMETGFHALLPAPLVMHFHSLPSVWMADDWFSNRPGFKEWVAASGYTLEFIGWVKPGLELCQKIELCDSKAQGIVLRNHGVVLASSDLSALTTWSEFEERYLARWHPQPPPATQWESAAGRLKWYFPDTAVFAERLLKHLEAAPGAAAGVLRPLASLSTDPDMQELWAATRQLEAYNPELAELPLDMLSQIASLPTEAFRKAQPVPGARKEP